MALFKKKAPQRAVTYTARMEERITKKDMEEAWGIIREIKMKVNYDTFKQDKPEMEQRVRKNKYLSKNKDFCSKIQKGLSLRDLEYLESLERKIRADMS